MLNKKTKTLPVQMIATLCILTVFLSLSQAEVTLTVGNGSGAPGTSDNPLSVSLDNSVVVTGMQMEVCESPETPNLTCTGCETTDRAPSGFSCNIKSKKIFLHHR